MNNTQTWHNIGTLVLSGILGFFLVLPQEECTKVFTFIIGSFHTWKMKKILSSMGILKENYYLTSRPLKF